MKTVFALIFCLTITSVVLADIQPIGSLGKGELREITFLPDGRILRVLSHRLELADPNTGATIARFADRTDAGIECVGLTSLLFPQSYWVVS